MNPVREHLVALLVGQFEVPRDAIGDDAALGELDLDSLARVELVVNLQEHWGVGLDDDGDSAADVTVGRLVDRVHELLAESTAQPGAPE
ncbi:acyl carrier protein [Streptomyces sp. BE20]|uniref:acyl carrier protein n=1 Tax=Streptomycetaceae TaxID=2062 RepID=UPI002E76E9FA|nr:MULTISPECIES: acyl carrier protein [unclassified Streptomyces]MED7953930.1 acyl carrier protein [Streptomyces sp. BE303]MEE1822644.1 acyl carrier protein [Streptomyces sp. BE20]